MSLQGRRRVDELGMREAISRTVVFLAMLVAEGLFLGEGVMGVPVLSTGSAYHLVSQHVVGEVAAGRSSCGWAADRHYWCP